MLVTGGTGFIGAHVCDILLRRNIRVVLASRTKAKAETFVSQRPQHKHLIKTILVPDFETDQNDGTASNPFVEAAKECDGIIHVASPFLAEIQNAEQQLINPAIKGVKLILEAAKENQATVKRLVLTSSFASVLDTNVKVSDDYVYSANDWNPITLEEAKLGDAVIAYRGSKKFAELEAWNFIKQNEDENEKDNVQFDLVTLCPPMVFGPVVHPVKTPQDLNVSNAVLWSIARGQHPLPVSRVPVWIDVRDVALAHVESLLRQEVGNQRFVLSSPEKFSYAWAAQIMKREDLSDEVSEDYGNQELHPEGGYQLDWAGAQEKLGLRFHGFEECVVDAITQFKLLE